MKRILIIFAILSLVFPWSALAVPAIPSYYWDAGYGIDTRAAYTGGNPTLYMVNSLESTNLSAGGYGYPTPALPTIELNGNEVITGTLEQIVEWINNAGDGWVIMFSVSGTIQVDETFDHSESDGVLPIFSSNGIIAGQTAPSPGITIRNGYLVILGDDILVQHIRIRMDDSEAGTNNYDVRRALGVGLDEIEPNNVVIDHCSLSWAIDVNASMGVATNVTWSNCIISEGLNDSFHSAGPHSKGMSTGRGATNIAVINNLISNTEDRTPLLQDGDKVIANNLLFNNKWFSANVNPTAVANFSYVGNVTKGGTISGTYASDYIMSLRTIYADGVGSSYYLLDNKSDAGTQSDADDWAMVDNRLEFTISNFKVLSAPLWPTGYSAMSSADVEAYIINHAGARPIDRDSVDSRLISEIGTNGGSLKNTPEEAGGFTANDGDCTDRSGTCQTWDLETDVNDSPMFLYNFPFSPHSDNTDDGYTADNTYTNLEEWLASLATYWETGIAGNPGNDFLDDPNCLHAYFDGSTAIEDGQNNNDLNAGAGESEWVNLSAEDWTDNAYISSSATRMYYCQTIADAGGLELSRTRIFPNNVGDLETPQKTLYIHKNTQVGGAGTALSGTPGTQVATVTGSNAWDYGAVDIDGDASFAQNDLICFSMQELDSEDYVKARLVPDTEAKLGDIQRFNSDGSYTDTIDADFKIVLYEVAGTPPDYVDSVATFNGSTQFLYQALTSLHANMIGRTGKTNGSFVLQDVSFPSFPTDGNEWTLIKLPDAYEMVVKTVGTDNLLELRVYDGSDWDAVAVTTVDLAVDTLYDIQFSIDNTNDLLIIDTATAADSIRVEPRVETAYADTPATPNTGNVTIGYDGSGEFFTGTWGTLVIFDDIPSATQFIDMLDGISNEPLPTCTSITFTSTSYDNDDIGVYIDGTSIWSKIVKFNSVKWDYSANDDVPCWFSSESGTLTPTVRCGPLAPGMIGTLTLKDANFTVVGSLVDETGINAVTDLTIPSITNPDIFAIYNNISASGGGSNTSASGGGGVAAP